MHVHVPVSVPVPACAAMTRPWVFESPGLSLKGAP